jgi:hypothetical protein
MNTKRIASNTLYLGALWAAVLLLTGPAARGFQRDEKAISPKPSSAVKSAAAAAQAPTASQIDAAALAAQSGVQVEWSARLGTPLSVRGADLGARQPFSGGKGYALQGGGAYAQDAIAVLDNLSRLYRFQDAAQEFAVKQADADTLDFHHVRLAQIYQGLRVVGGDVIVHFDASGQAYQVNGQYVAGLQLEAAPQIEAAAAVSLAQQDLAALGKSAGSPVGEAALVVFARDAAPHLAYELVLVYDDSAAGPGRWRYWVDARQGTVLLRYSDIQKIAPRRPTA